MSLIAIRLYTLVAVTTALVFYVYIDRAMAVAVLIATACGLEAAISDLGRE